VAKAHADEDTDESRNRIAAHGERGTLDALARQSRR
jgi:hypothetical protein